MVLTVFLGCHVAMHSAVNVFSGSLYTSRPNHTTYVGNVLMSIVTVLRKPLSWPTSSGISSSVAVSYCLLHPSTIPASLESSSRNFSMIDLHTFTYLSKFPIHLLIDHFYIMNHIALSSLLPLNSPMKRVLIIQWFVIWEQR